MSRNKHRTTVHQVTILYHKQHIIHLHTSCFPLRKLKGSQPFPKKLTVHLVQLEEEDVDDRVDPESDDPDGVKRVTEEFMVQLARAVKDAQMDKGTAIIAAAPNTLSVIAHS